MSWSRHFVSLADITGSHSDTKRQVLGICALFSVFLFPVWCRLFFECNPRQQQYTGKSSSLLIIMFQLQYLKWPTPHVERCTDFWIPLVICIIFARMYIHQYFLSEVFHHQPIVLLWNTLVSNSCIWLQVYAYSWFVLFALVIIFKVISAPPSSGSLFHVLEFYIM